MRTAWVVLLLCSCSLASRPLSLRIDSEPGAAITDWLAIDAPGFTLVTDLSPSLAQDAAQEIAAELAAINAAFGDAPPRFDHRLDIVVFANGLDFEARFGRTAGAAIIHKLREKRLVVQTWGTVDRWLQHLPEGSVVSAGSMMRHGISQAVLARQFPEPIPKWFGFGMAAYVETLAWSEDRKAIRLGAANGRLLEWYRSSRTVGFTEATGPRTEHPGQEDAYGRAYEGYCWALTYTAIHASPRGLSAYMQALAAGDPADPAMVFEGKTADEIDQQVEQFMRGGRGAFRRVPVVVPAGVAKMRPLTAEELTRWVQPAPPRPWQ